MEVALNIVVDASGSMAEMGKIYLLRNLCRYISQLAKFEPEKYADIHFCFYQWTDSVREIAMQNNGDIPVLTATGSATLESLSKFINGKLNGIAKQYLLVLSDGNFSSSDVSGFQKYANSIPNLFIHSIAVGADADLLKLQNLSNNNRVYLAENIAAAVNSIIFANSVVLTAPESIAQICLPKVPFEIEEDWDE